MKEQRTLTADELDQIQMYAADKYAHIKTHREWFSAIMQFTEAYINGGVVVVFNERNQIMADFEDFSDALDYIEQNEPKCGILKL